MGRRWQSGKQDRLTGGGEVLGRDSKQNLKWEEEICMESMERSMV